MVSLLVFIFGLHVYAQEDVQQPRCIRPRDKPKADVGIIYLSGWFPFNNEISRQGAKPIVPGHITLERNSRKRLQELADKTGHSIAVPLPISDNGKGERSWQPSPRPGTAAPLLAKIEAAATSACAGHRFIQGITLIGHSSGGYTTRELALQCAAKKPKYSAVIMSGARARSGQPTGPDCAKLIAVRGKGDPIDACNDKGCKSTTDFNIAAQNMVKSIGGNGAVLAPYSGGHILPPITQLAEVIRPAGNLVATVKPPFKLTGQTTEIVTSPPQMSPPLRVTPPYSSGFLTDSTR